MQNSSSAVSLRRIRPPSSQGVMGGEIPQSRRPLHFKPSRPALRAEVGDGMVTESQ